MKEGKVRQSVALIIVSFLGLLLWLALKHHKLTIHQDVDSGYHIAYD